LNVVQRCRLQVVNVTLRDVSRDVTNDVCRNNVDFRPVDDPVRMRGDVRWAWHRPRDQCAAFRNIRRRNICRRKWI